MSSDLYRLIQSYKYIKFLIGTQKIKMTEGVIVEMGLAYKIFSWSLGLIFPIIIFVSVIEFVKVTFGKLVISLATVIFLTHSFLITFYVISTITKSKYLKKIIEGIIKFDTILNIQLVRKPFLCSKLCLVLTFYLILKITQIIYDYVSWDSPNYCTIVAFYFLSCIMEIEVGYFVVKTNILARRFEILNELLKIYGINKFHLKETYFEIDCGILHRIWKNKNDDLVKSQCFDLNRLMNAYKILVDVTSDVSDFYGLMVWHF